MHESYNLGRKEPKIQQEITGKDENRQVIEGEGDVGNKQTNKKDNSTKLKINLNCSFRVYTSIILSVGKKWKNQYCHFRKNQPISGRAGLHTPVIQQFHVQMRPQRNSDICVQGEKDECYHIGNLEMASVQRNG